MKTFFLIAVIALLLVAGCKDITDTYKPGSFGNSPEDQKIVEYYKNKFGDLTESGTPRILEPLMSSEVTDYIPMNKVTKFSKETDKLYAWFVYDNFKENDPINVEWKFLDNDFVIYTFNSNAGGDFGRGVFILEKPDDGWPVGKYQVTISGMGASGKLNFEIINGATMTEKLPYDTGSASNGGDSSEESTPPTELGDQLYTNNNIGACGYTDTSTFDIPEEVYVSKLRMWYYWSKDETTLPFTLTKDGVEFAKGNLVRSECDPYQTSWCEANLFPKKNYPAGKYVMKVATSKLCQNSQSGGNGMYLVYGKKLGKSSPSSAETKTASGFEIKNTDCTYAGKWSSNWGDMEFKQTGNKVTATYTHDQGKISATANENVLIGKWSEYPSYSEPRDEGDVELLISEDCQSFTGNWRYGSTGDWSGGWTGTFVSK